MASRSGIVYAVHRLAKTPALARLEWILDGIDGSPGWGADIADVLAPEFTALVPPQTYLQRCRARTQRYAPVVVTRVDAGQTTASARLRNHEGSIDVLHCSVEPEPPHRIVMTWVQGEVPVGLNPRLPERFDSYDLEPGGGSLIVFSGLPGCGKSTLADQVGRALATPVFAVDWLLGALTPFGGRHFDDQFGIGFEQLTTLALRQLELGQSAILDAPVEDVATRERWRSLAARAGARFVVILCVCSDPQVHQTRLKERQRGIAGWHDGGDWSNVRQRLAAFPPWTGDVLTVDAVAPVEENLRAVLRHLSDPA